MEPLYIDSESIAYIRSEAEFSQARMKAFLEIIMGLIRGHDMQMLSFDEVVEKLRLKESIYLGLQDIPLDHIAGSTGRYEDFTRHFLPRSFNKRDKERWRKIYTLAVTGKGFPPIDVYKIDQVYFVKDGNHRVSVARDLGWDTVQAHVTELPSSISLEPDVEPHEMMIKSECAYFLEQTQLDQTRPDSKHRIDFSVLGGYTSLLEHIKLCRYLLEKENSKISEIPAQITLAEAAAQWYDNIYLPIVETVRAADIIKHFPSRMESDLYMWLIQNQNALCEHHSLNQFDLPYRVIEFLQTIHQKSETKAK